MDIGQIRLTAVAAGGGGTGFETLDFDRSESIFSIISNSDLIVALVESSLRAACRSDGVDDDMMRQSFVQWIDLDVQLPILHSSGLRLTHPPSPARICLAPSEP